MARTQVVSEVVSDDVDGSTKNVTTYTFAFEGQAYEIDLASKNAKALAADMSKWTEHARKVRRTASGRRRQTSKGSKAVSESATIRAWAAENGVEVPARGRIPAAVIEQYRNG